MFLLSNFRKGSNHCENFTRSSHGIKDNEEGISHPSKEIRDGFEETKSVEGISDYFGDGPSNKKHQNSDTASGLEIHKIKIEIYVQILPMEPCKE